MSRELQTVGQAGLVAGIEGIDDRDRRRGNIVLVQDNSKYFRGLGHEPGEFVNTANNKAIQNTEFIPCFMTKYFDCYEWANSRAKWIFRTIDEQDARLEGKRWRQDGDKRAEVIPVIACVAIVEGQPAQIAFKKLSGYPAGQKLYSFAREYAEKDGIPLYGFKYKLIAKEGHSRAGDEFWTIDVEPVGPSDEDQQRVAGAVCRSLSGRRSEVAKEASAEDEAPF